MDRILVNACRDKLRRRGRVREVDLASRPDLEDRLVVADRSDSLIARDLVGRALARLTFDQRTVVVLRFWRDMSLEQIADHLGWPLGTVKSRLHHALAALKGALEQDEIEVAR
jgi:RNA polymerase sigma-70 factor (ECF subfamily)